MMNIRGTIRVKNEEVHIFTGYRSMKSAAFKEKVFVHTYMYIYISIYISPVL